MLPADRRTTTTRTRSRGAPPSPGRPSRRLAPPEALWRSLELHAPASGLAHGPHGVSRHAARPGPPS